MEELKDFMPYYIEDECKTRKENIEQINREVQEINNMFVDLNYYVSSQQDNLDLIDDNISKSKIKVNDASKELEKADKYQKKGRKLKTKILTGVAIIVGIPIGIVAGPKIAVGVTCGVILTSIGTSI